MAQKELQGTCGPKKNYKGLVAQKELPGVCGPKRTTWGLWPKTNYLGLVAQNELIITEKGKEDGERQNVRKRVERQQSNAFTHND